MKEVYKKCSRCVDGMESVTAPLQGGGSEVTSVTCRTCNGTTTVPDGSYLSDDLVTFLNDMGTVLNDVKEKVDEIKAVVDSL